MLTQVKIKHNLCLVIRVAEESKIFWWSQSLHPNNTRNRIWTFLSDSDSWSPN